MSTNLTLLEEWLQFADKLLGAGIEVIATGNYVHTEEGIANPKLLSRLLLARTMSHFKGIRLLVRARRAVEARMLTRNVFENSFWVGTLAKEGSAFSKQMVADDRKRQMTRGQLVFEQRHELEDYVYRGMREWMRKNADWKKGNTLNPKEVAAGSALGKAYFVYSEMSVDAHPSIETLRRYLQPEDEEGFLDLALEPFVHDEELVTTMAWAAAGAIGLLIAVNGIVEGTAAKTINALSAEFEVLNDRSKVD